MSVIKLFQLRLGLSSLRYHKKCHTSLMPLLTIVFVIKVLKIRITSYFCVIFFCYLRRATLVINVITILQKYDKTHLGNQSHLYLYGHRTINLADNKKTPLVDNRIYKTPSVSPLKNSLPFPSPVFLSSYFISVLFISFILLSYMIFVVVFYFVNYIC